MKRFDSLEPKRKKQVIWAAIGILLSCVILVGYNLRSTPGILLAREQTATAIDLEPDLIQKTMLREQRRELDTLRTALEELKQEVRVSEPRQDDAAVVPSAEEIAASATPAAEELVRWPMPLAEEEVVGGSTVPQVTLPEPEPVMIGEIGVLSNPVLPEIDDEHKKKGRTVYLPPSFMEARLLTGFDASTSGKGTGNPEPLLLRIQTPAVLPNEIKADLEGCFVVAEAVGRLDKERADVRLVSLSCLTKEGAAVIDTQVKGFVTDADSKVGLSGRVVSRMGAATARAVVAGVFGGAGDWLKAASTTTSVSALGSTQTVDGSDIVPYAVGGGMAEGAETLRDFYVELVQQTTPVIEVGATKKVTVIVSEGKDLEIREIDSETM